MRVIVVGGGIVGASAAFHLARRGVATTLVDAGHVGRATSAGAGVVFPRPLPWDPEPLRALTLAAAAHYPALMTELAEDGHTTGYQAVEGMSVSAGAATADREHALLGQMAAQPGCAGLGGVRRLARGEPARRVPVLPEHLEGVAFGGMARLDGRLARNALVDAAEERGLRRVGGDAELLGDGTRITGVRAGGEDLSADAVVVAAGAWTARLLAPFGVRVPVFPVRGQITHVALPETSTRDWPVVRFADHDRFMVAFPPNRIVLNATHEPDAGFDHRVTVAGLRQVLADAVETAPGLAEATVLETRVGFRPGSRDGLPILGPVESLPGVVVATGLGPSGLTLGPHQGALAARLAMGEAVGIDLDPFRPDRDTGRS
ncbi:FAD-dependent oxidoreductase [Thermobifida halotolerans]|uniref:FAD-dependent oxidoreductase n=1 Tax=Thermobifida halotolerans TaxID=483545 RepID=A0A399G9D0_9ACTN|nr:FAD-binding oxidoreductase [Thermobifida halotolerans]UOE20900.1 FAD-dependent oxidoreductase [Thermobifida halotolerans]